ncbi:MULTISPECIES: hypothetical protein [Halomonadaceae]|uniref:hypothetical protein n=1 Tax=Halomonadaceae TaxID=28256 RepID=UPI00078031B2|nr:MULTISPECIES: hypothetical protein [Halomonas]|tara:strand:- start:189 stop:509 length:321 start_codon:yes stop_codon:yes gene_type:complete
MVTGHGNGQIDIARALGPGDLEVTQKKVPDSSATKGLAAMAGEIVLCWFGSAACRKQTAPLILEGIGHAPWVECPTLLAELLLKHPGGLKGANAYIGHCTNDQKNA